MVAVADLARSAGSDIDAYQARRNSDRIGEALAKLTSAREAAAAEGLDQVVASIARTAGAFGTLADHTRSVEAARGTLLAGLAGMEVLARASARAVGEARVMRWGRGWAGHH